MAHRAKADLLCHSAQQSAQASVQGILWSYTNRSRRDNILSSHTGHIAPLRSLYNSRNSTAGGPGSAKRSTGSARESEPLLARESVSSSGVVLLLIHHLGC